ncbi:MAG: hypothetical protein H7Y88_11405, partial [Phycisphaerales bacterium]|nr:hypothetical protein [Phycisphaerales bacterium]
MNGKSDRVQVALSIENDRMVAVAATIATARVRIDAWTAAARPSNVDMSDAVAVGQWVAAELRQAGLLGAAKRGGLVFAVPRGEVVLKRIAFPGNPGAAELPEMVRLQMLRQLTVSPETAAIDFISLGSPPLASVKAGVKA